MSFSLVLYIPYVHIGHDLCNTCRTCREKGQKKCTVIEITSPGTGLGVEVGLKVGAGLGMGAGLGVGVGLGVGDIAVGNNYTMDITGLRKGIHFQIKLGLSVCLHLNKNLLRYFSVCHFVLIYAKHILSNK